MGTGAQGTVQLLNGTDITATAVLMLLMPPATTVGLQPAEGNG